MKGSVPPPVAVQIRSDERGAVEWVYDVGSSVETERASVWELEWGYVTVVCMC